MKNDVSNDDLIIHALNNLPKEYETAVEVLKRTIDDENNP